MFLGGMISAPGHARETAPPMPGSCFIPDVNPFGSSRDYGEPRTTWCCSQVRSRRGNAPATASLGRCNRARAPRPHRTAPDRPARAARGPGSQRRNTLWIRGGELHHRYGARSACLYVVRPDGYIGFRSQPPDPEALKSYFTPNISLEEGPTMKILVVHGAGMNMRGKAQVETFGPMTLPEYDAKIRAYADELGVEIEIFHSNIEGEVINRLYAAHDEGIAGAIINPAGYSRGYPALVAAIGNVGFPTIEVHISNPARRGTVSEVASTCLGTVTGFGIAGYALALRGLQDRAKAAGLANQPPPARRARPADAGLAHLAAVAVGVGTAAGVEEGSGYPGRRRRPVARRGRRRVLAGSQLRSVRRSGRGRRPGSCPRSPGCGSRGTGSSLPSPDWSGRAAGATGGSEAASSKKGIRRPGATFERE